MRPSAEQVQPGNGASRSRPPLPAAALRVLSDERLARLAASGDRVAFSVIFDRYGQDLYAYCASLLRNREDAADALQSTMLRALHALDGEQREIAIRPWLYRIAHNESVNLLRRPRTEPADAGRVSVLDDVEASADVRAQLRAVLDDIRELPERQRGALVMRELSGLEYDEIAVALKTSAAGAKQAVYDARRALHELARGRDTDCDAIRRAISDGDRRRVRARPVRAHLSNCTGCRSFQLEMAGRRSSLASFTPALPATAAVHALQGALAGTTAGTGLTTATGQAAAVAAVAAALGAGAIGVGELRERDSAGSRAEAMATGPGAVGYGGKNARETRSRGARARAAGRGAAGRAGGRSRGGSAAGGRGRSERLGRADGAPPPRYSVDRSTSGTPYYGGVATATPGQAPATVDRRGPIRRFIRPGAPGRTNDGPIRGTVDETRGTVNGAVDGAQQALPVPTPPVPSVPVVRPPSPRR
jgi:RNA polymerase sigma factor (sigma-70 family)